MTDGQLLASYADDGSREAMDRLVERHAPMVYSTCLRVTGSRRLAEDAARAVFLLLFRRAGALAGRRTVCGWLHATAYRAACRALEESGDEEILVETRELAAVD